MWIGPALLASLEPSESKPHVYRNRDAKRQLSWSKACTFRHSGWRHHRERVFQALVDTHQPFSALEQFKYCGLHAYVLQSLEDPTEYRVAGSSCHHRFCLPCANERSRVIALNVLAQLGKKRARFLTLTMRSTNETLEYLLTKLSTCFAQLRRKALWRKRVTGGVSFIELKWNDELERWNVHLHAIVQGRYLDVVQLSKAWKHVTRDSLIVDIRAIKDNRHVARYVTKYACKPLHSSVLHNDERLREAIVALRGKRLATTFGDWRGVLLTPKPDEASWKNLGSLNDVIARAEANEPDALLICRSLNVELVHSLNHTEQSRAPPVSTIQAPAQMVLPLEPRMCTSEPDLH